MPIASGEISRQAGHTQRNVATRMLGRQGTQQRRSLGGIQMRQYQRDRLWMLVVQELRKLLRIGLLQRIEGHHVFAEG